MFDELMGINYYLLLVPTSILLQNLDTLFKNVPDSNLYHTVLSTLAVPGKLFQDLFKDMEQQYPGLSKKQVIIQSFLDAYSHLSWRLIAHKIYLWEKSKQKTDVVCDSGYKLIMNIQRNFQGKDLLNCTDSTCNQLQPLIFLKALPLWSWRWGRGGLGLEKPNKRSVSGEGKSQTSVQNSVHC